MIRNALLLAVVAAVMGSVLRAHSQDAANASRPAFDQLMTAAEKASAENRDDEAIRLYRRALAEKPDSEEALWYLGSTLYEKEQFADARDVLRQFMTARPDAGPGWAVLGLSEFQLKEYSRALDHLQRAVAQGIGSRESLLQTVYFHIVILLTRFERYDDSLDMLQRLLATGSSDPALIKPAGLAGLRLPYLPAEIPPDQRNLIDLRGKAVMAVQTQHYPEADSAFTQLLEAYPSQPGVHFLRGAYLAQLHPQEAVPEFERELQISPSHLLARVRLAQQLLTDGNVDHALELAQQAIQLDPKRASAHMMAGEALIAKGDANCGISELETARDTDSSIARAHWDLLRAYAAAGRKEDAAREKLEIDKLLHGDPARRSQSLGDSSHDSPPHD